MDTCKSQWTHLPLLFLSLFFTVGSADHYPTPRNVGLRPDSTPERHLQIAANGAPFKIALFADLHFGEAASTDWGPLQDVNSTRVMNQVLHDETPDFVIYLGDVITANNIMTKNASLYWDQATSPTRNKGIPWASVFGNHDDAPFEWSLGWFSSPRIPPLICTQPTSSYSGEECSLKGTGRLELMKNEIKNSASFSVIGPRDLWPSVSNYALQISSSDDPKSPVAFLYFLDSGGGSYPEVVSSGQAEWFKEKAEDINPDSRVPEIIFWHIPSEAYKEVALKSTIANTCVGSLNDEEVTAQKTETGIMKLLEERSSVKAIFVGHNHGLDWCCPYKKLWLCYARHTGYGGYGNWSRGARIVEISEKPFSLRSWIRMEDGDVHSRVGISGHSEAVFSGHEKTLTKLYTVDLQCCIKAMFPGSVHNQKNCVNVRSLKNKESHSSWNSVPNDFSWTPHSQRATLPSPMLMDHSMSKKCPPFRTEVRRRARINYRRDWSELGPK